VVIKHVFYKRYFLQTIFQNVIISSGNLVKSGKLTSPLSKFFGGHYPLSMITITFIDVISHNNSYFFQVKHKLTCGSKRHNKFGLKQINLNWPNNYRQEYARMLRVGMQIMVTLYA